MERKKFVFFRNAFFRAFVVGVAFTLLYLTAAYVFWGAAVPALALHWMARAK